MQNFSAWNHELGKVARLSVPLSRKANVEIDAMGHEISAAARVELRRGARYLAEERAASLKTDSGWTIAAE